MICPSFRHHSEAIFEKSVSPALSACMVFQMVTGPSRSQTKSIDSSRIDCSGRAARWVPVIMILIDGSWPWISCTTRPAADMFWVEAEGWNP